MDKTCSMSSACSKGSLTLTLARALALTLTRPDLLKGYLLLMTYYLLLTCSMSSAVPKGGAPAW